MGRYRWDSTIVNGRASYRGGKNDEMRVYYDKDNSLWIVGPFGLPGCSLYVLGRDAFTPNEAQNEWRVYEGFPENPDLQVVSPPNLTNSLHVHMSPASGSSDDPFLSHLFGDYQKHSILNGRAFYIGVNNRTAVWYVSNRWYIGSERDFGTTHAPIFARSNANTPDDVPTGRWKTSMYTPKKEVRCERAWE